MEYWPSGTVQIMTGDGKELGGLNAQVRGKSQDSGTGWELRELHETMDGMRFQLIDPDTDTCLSYDWSPTTLAMYSCENSVGEGGPQEWEFRRTSSGGYTIHSYYDVEGSGSGEDGMPIGLVGSEAYLTWDDEREWYAPALQPWTQYDESSAAFRAYAHRLLVVPSGVEAPFTLEIVAADHFGGNFSIAILGVSTEASTGSSAVVAVPALAVFVPVADSPMLLAPRTVRGVEDIMLHVGLRALALVDIDGSESLSLGVRAALDAGLHVVRVNGTDITPTTSGDRNEFAIPLAPIDMMGDYAVAGV